MSQLFSLLKLRGVEFKNRVFVSPMCQYSSEDLPTDWHLVHLGSRAVGGAGMVMVEASAVNPEGRISPWDSGIWSEEHAEKFRRITDFISQQGAVPRIQLSHAGRKASTQRPWDGGGPYSGEESWTPLAPSAVHFEEGWHEPSELTEKDLDALVADFRRAARFSLQAGFRVVEVHMAHGYLLHESLSPLSNRRDDLYGGSRENRMRLPLRVAEAVRDEWPDELPVFVRVSATDWVEGGWELADTVELARHLRELGVDLVDCSSGGNVPNADIPVKKDYQTPFAAEIRRQTGIATGAVGLMNRSPAFREDSLRRRRRRGAAGPRAAARPLLAAALRPRAGRGPGMAPAVLARQAPRLATELSHGSQAHHRDVTVGLALVFRISGVHPHQPVPEFVPVVAGGLHRYDRQPPVGEDHAGARVGLEVEPPRRMRGGAAVGGDYDQVFAIWQVEERSVALGPGPTTGGHEHQNRASRDAAAEPAAGEAVDTRVQTRQRALDAGHGSRIRPAPPGAHTGRLSSQISPPGAAR